MKIIHSFKKLEKGKNLNDEFVLTYMSISALCAKKHWGNIHLYCDEESAEIVKEIGIPYDTINTELFENYNFGDVFSIPKIKVFEDQKEPFLHIDYDTFFFERRPFEEHHRIIYSHPDFNFINLFKEMSEQIQVLIQRDRPRLDDLINVKWDQNILGWFHTYFDTLYRYPDLLPQELQERVLIDFTPNFNVFGGYDHEIISKAATYILNLYEDKREIWDKNYHYNACILEQLLYFPVIKLLDKDNDINLRIQDMNENNLFDSSIVPMSSEVPVTLSMEGKSQVITCHGKKIKRFLHADYSYNIQQLVDFAFGGYTHLGSPMKESREVLEMIKKKGIKYYGAEEIVNKLNRKFKSGII
jgi:hypothetical protein